jgi:hypothetical protein
MAMQGEGVLQGRGGGGWAGRPVAGGSWSAWGQRRSMSCWMACLMAGSQAAARARRAKAQDFGGGFLGGFGDKGANPKSFSHPGAMQLGVRFPKRDQEFCSASEACGSASFIRSVERKRIARLLSVMATFGR